MASFQVRGITAEGKLLEQVLAASSAAEAERMGQAGGLDVIDVRSMGWSLTLGRSSSRFDLALFAQELVSLLRAGLSLIEALDALVERQQEVQPGSPLLASLAKQMREGNSFSCALGAHPEQFPGLFVASIAASEETGEMVDALERYLRYHEQVGLIRQRIISAALYPAMLALVGGGVALFLLCFLVPRFSHIYAGMGTDLPLASRLLMGWGAFVAEHTWGVFTGSIAAMAGLLAIVRQPGAQASLMARVQHNRWIGAYVRLMQLSRFYRSLGLLLRGGIPAVKALQMTQPLLPGNLRDALGEAIRAVEQGQSMSDSLRSAQLTTPVALRLLRAGERNGQLADMLEQASAFHDKEVGYWIERFSRLFEPILMLVIGLVIGGIVILLYLPIFELAGSL